MSWAISPIWAIPDAAYEPVIWYATIGTSTKVVMNAVVASSEPIQSKRKSR